MNKILIVVFGLFITIANAQIKGDSWQKVKSEGKGVIAVVYYEQPGLIQNVKGEMKGVCVDILNDFRQFVRTKYGKEVEVKFVSHEKEFAAFLAAVQNGDNVLGVTNTSITAERKKILKYSPPYMATLTVLLTNEKVPTLKSMDQIATAFKGFTAEVIAGSTHVHTVKNLKKQQLPNLEIKEVGSSEVVLKDLTTNARMFSVLDFTEYVSVIRRQLPVKRHEIELGTAEELGFIMPKSSDWDALWNEFLTPDYRKSTHYKQIISQNLGSTFLSLVR